MQVTRIATTDALTRLGSHWNALADNVPFRTWQWLFPWWRHYGEGKSLYTLAVHDDGGRLIGIAPWFREDRGGDGRVIQFLGSGEVCSEYMTILAAPERVDDVARALSDWLMEAAAQPAGADDRWELLDFDGVAVEDEPLAALAAQLQARGGTVKRRPGMDCWRFPLPGTWDEFTSRVSPSHARQVRRVRRRLIDSGRGVVRTVADPGELDKGMRILVDLHQRRWTGLGEPGCFASANFHDFLHAAAADLLSADMLRLSWLEIDNQPAAVEFLLSSGGVLYAYQGGLAPEMRKQSPGHGLLSTVFMDAIDTGYHAVDFLRGDESYKASWGARPLPTERLRVAPGRLGPQIRNQAWFAGQVMKGWVKQHLTAAGVY